MATESRELTSIFYLPELRQPAFKEAQWQRSRLIAFGETQIKKGIETGKFRSLNTVLTAEQIFQLTETNLIALQPDKLGSPLEQATETTDFIMRGILLKPSRLNSIARKAGACLLRIGPED